jgi:hypothetical protein
LRKYRFHIISVLLLAFVIAGWCGTVAFDLIQDDLAFHHALWFIIPSLPVAVYYAWWLTAKDSKKNIFLYGLTICLMSLLFLSVLITAFKGYLIAYNYAAGPQKKVRLKGEIIEVSVPSKKRSWLSSYSLTIRQEADGKIIRPTLILTRR